MTQQPLMTPQEEIDLAQSLPEGAYLSSDAQVLYESQGAARFAKFHPKAVNGITLEGGNRSRG